MTAVNVTIDGNAAGRGGDGGLAIGGHGGHGINGISGGNGGDTDSGNGGSAGEGGGLYASGGATLTQVTITGNAAGGGFGARRGLLRPAGKRRNSRARLTSA